MTARVVAMSHSHALIAEAHVDERLLVVMVASAAERVAVLALELVLNPLTVGSVADKRKNRADALNEQGTLAGLSIVKGGLQNPRSIHCTAGEATSRRDVPAHSNCHRNLSTVSPGGFGSEAR